MLSRVRSLVERLSMVLWEITLATAYFLGLRRTYRLALQIQRRLLKRRPATRAFVNRRTQAAFRLALRVVSDIQQRDLSLGRSWGNAILRFLDRMKPSAQMRLPTPPNSHQSTEPALVEKLPTMSPVTGVLNSAQKVYLKELKRREAAEEDHFAVSQDQERQKSDSGEGIGKSPSLEPELVRAKQALYDSTGHLSEAPEKLHGDSSAANGQARGLHTSSHDVKGYGIMGVRGTGVAQSIVSGAWQTRRRTEGMFNGSMCPVPARLQSVGFSTNQHCSLERKQRMDGFRVWEDWKRGSLRPDIAQLLKYTTEVIKVRM